MATTVNDIRVWLKGAKAQNSTHMIIVCDTFDYEDYPVYVPLGADVHKVIEANTNSMSKVMEVYAMHLPLEEQLKEARAFNYDAPPSP